MLDRSTRLDRIFVLLLLVCMAVPTAALAQEPEIEAETEASGRSTANVLLHALGGVVVGGWLGWMGSQVSYSDWNEEVDGEFASQRRGWWVPRWPRRPGPS